ncbi:nucleotidyltransferase [Paenibacillus contaminans]|uniref:tRNA(Met) cytidine acetate ligase n=1 Tax=Paenibacillus contaminans TaxID=450362 RepID=A0A329MJJ4_9BACL|nr:nucleotidyltransferase [Paenibacillus contaminans]RAV19984.1 nucleotidyltransferase [Paenibacillus contaminans]
MKTVGIVVEYNPLHYGHVYHYEQAKRIAGADAAIAVMSGHFLQRGEPALANKWARAEMALRMGADVVLELPVAFSSQPAEWFAYGAVSALNATGVADSLCFGSESGDIRLLERIAEHLHREPETFKQLLQLYLSKGLSYPAAYSSAADSFLRDHDRLAAEPEEGSLHDLLKQPNNTLGLHYLLALKRLNSPIVPLTVSRTKAGYHQQVPTDGQIASATAIRRILFEERRLDGIASFVPQATLDIMRREMEAGRAPIEWERYAQPLIHLLASRTEEELARISEVNEGLEHRLKQSLRLLPHGAERPVEALLDAMKTKRYTRTRLQRTLLRIFLGHGKAELSREKLLGGVPYLRVLGFTAKGRKLLAQMRKKATVPVVVKVTGIQSPFLDLDIRATAAYALGYDALAPEELHRDYYQAPLQAE